ncbi:VapD [Ignatzschineria rhizosphaerae]|uniref:VapD n=1 Tax=Ignatzschineria rhizosphaerae TaxID=2923279 RepID=A0ABY3X2P8_9GAMM|nr:VapD [Ignatzschineria rhizosphaerae]UNM97124.1 VapD [Ignatzschineria rhizosphaerae]
MSRYLIILDIDTNHLVKKFHTNIDEACVCIRKILENHGFRNIQGIVYVGNQGIGETHATIAIQEVAYRYEWFNSCVSNIRFYRIENELKAQFISDRAHEAKLAAQTRLELLRKNLIKSGLSEIQIEKVLIEQY